MATHFEKRKAKSVPDIVKQIEEKRDDIRAKAEPVYTHIGYDIYTPDGGKSYKVAEFSYNPDTGEASITDTYEVSRLVALSYENKKTALRILKKKR